MNLFTYLPQSESRNISEYQDDSICLSLIFETNYAKILHVSCILQSALLTVKYF